MAESLCVPVPLCLPLLTPNLRLHWAARARATQIQRGMAYLCAKLALNAATWPDLPYSVPFAGRVRLDVTVYPLPRMKTHDDDNAWIACKAYRDGLADALGLDDKQFRQGTLTWDKRNRSGEIVFTLSQED